MIEIRHILCPIDFSDHSRLAFDHALAMARWYDARITVLHVHPPLDVTAGGGDPLFAPLVMTQEARDGLLLRIRSFIESEAAPGIRIDGLVREGNAVSQILKAATELQPDLLVLGTHGRSGFERLLLGSVTEKVLRKAECPVLTVPRLHPDAVPAGPIVFKRILCPMDFSDCSRSALRYAASLAQEADGDLTVMYVMANDLEPLPRAPADEIANEHLSVGEFFIRRDADARRRLQDAVPGEVSTYCSVETLMAHGKPGDEILRVAGEQTVDVVVMGVRGRGAADRLIFGSTTDYVVRRATCPILTIHGVRSTPV